MKSKPFKRDKRIDGKRRMLVRVKESNIAQSYCTKKRRIKWHKKKEVSNVLFLIVEDEGDEGKMQLLFLLNRG